MPTAAPAQRIDTKTVKDRPTLRFATVDECLAYARRLADAERAGTLAQLGNWTLGECFSHISAFASYALDGYPPGLKPPLLLKLILRALKAKMLKGPLPAGAKIPGTKDGTVGAIKMPTDDALRRLEAALRRLEAHAPTEPNPVFGPLSHDEWITIQLRHAELHMSFYRIGENT